MKNPTSAICCLIGLSAMLCVPASARVHIRSFHPSVPSPQVIGTAVTWTAKASDSASNPLTFQFSVAPPGKHFALVKDFNVGTKGAQLWSSLPFTWVPTHSEGIYQIKVIAKDFTTGESTSQIAKFKVSPLVTGANPVVVGTAHPLVALFSAPACATGSTMRVSFVPQSGSAPSVMTSAARCDGVRTMTFEIAGMYPSTAYNMVAQTITGSSTVNSQPVSFTTGALPANIKFAPVKSKVAPGPNTDTADWVLLQNLVQFGNAPQYPDVASDLSGNVIWYYNPPQSNVLSRLLPNGTFLSIESNGPAWNPNAIRAQYLRQVDFAGNIVHETNTGILQQQLQAMGAKDAQACDKIASPPPIGAACLGAFHHDAIQSLPNGYTVALADVEKIFPAGQMGDTSGKPVDIIGDFLIVLDQNWQVKWYFDTFDHATGAPQLDINRPPVLFGSATCAANQGGCPPIQLIGSSSLAPYAIDWLHMNTIYYWPAPDDGNLTGGDLLISSRHQDWIMKVDYKDTKGTGNILWRMGVSGDFAFNNFTSDPWPWFSSQHDIGMEKGGQGPLTLYDNGDTRISPSSGPGSSTGGMPGLGKNCNPPGGPNDCNSRGMALTVDEASMTVTPLLSVDLGAYSGADGSAQLLSNGNYFYLPAIVYQGVNSANSQCIEIYPTSGTTTGTQVYNLQTSTAYRSWQMPSLYEPPIT